MNLLRVILLIGLGGSIGSIFRYLAALYVHRHYPGTFPMGTFLINVIGSFLIGLLIGWIERFHLSDSDLKFLFITGFCGGFTTFSAFSFESISLFQTGNHTTAFLYIGFSIITGLMATWLGLFFIKVM